MSLFIKICGLRTLDEVLHCVELGADAVGFVLSPSPRQVSLDQARKLLEFVPLQTQGFLVHRELTEFEPNLLPLRAGVQGTLPNPGFPGSAVLPTLRDGPNLLERSLAVWRLLGPHTLLLIDGPRPGSGTPADWHRVARVSTAGPVCLAGGLAPDTVGRAIEIVRPTGVDVSSGVESAPGRKDPIRIRDFIQAARESALTVGRTLCIP